jgi:hypothetical protein
MGISVKDNRLWLKVYKWIKGGIFNGVLADGTSLSENMPAPEMGPQGIIHGTYDVGGIIRPLMIWVS